MVDVIAPIVPYPAAGSVEFGFEKVVWLNTLNASKRASIEYTSANFTSFDNAKSNCR